MQPARFELTGNPTTQSTQQQPAAAAFHRTAFLRNKKQYQQKLVKINVKFIRPRSLASRFGLWMKVASEATAMIIYYHFSREHTAT